jgi:hypothetical protein
VRPHTVAWNEVRYLTVLTPIVQRVEEVSMSRITTSVVAGVSALAMIAGSFTAAEAAPLPAQSAVQVGGPSTQIDTVGWRRGYYGGYGYRRGYGGRVAGAVAAGAALGIIGGALAASAAPRYGYYGGGYGYPAYGYGYAPVRSYGYAPVRSYGYPAYGYPAYGYDDYGW